MLFFFFFFLRREIQNQQVRRSERRHVDFVPLLFKITFTHKIRHDTGMVESWCTLSSPRFLGMLTLRPSARAVLLSGAARTHATLFSLFCSWLRIELKTYLQFSECLLISVVLLVVLRKARSSSKQSALNATPWPRLISSACILIQSFRLPLG